MTRLSFTRLAHGDRATILPDMAIYLTKAGQVVIRVYGEGTFVYERSARRAARSFIRELMP